MQIVDTTKRKIETVLRIGLGGIFIYAGMSKIGAASAFADSIASFDFVPHFLINFVALFLPPLEIIAGAAVIAGPFIKDAAFTIFLLCILFALLLSQAAVRGLEVDCGCFGNDSSSKGQTWLLLMRNCVFGAIAFWVYSRRGHD